MNLDCTVDELIGTVSNPSSIRGFVNLSMPFSNDVTVMRAMFAGQSLSIVPTPAQVALYGGIPSLLYCSLSTGDEILTPKFRCDYEIEREPIKSEVKMPLFLGFVREVLTGIREHETVRRFDMFSSIDASRKSSWPLCFISPILVAISREMGVKMLRDIANKIADLIDHDLSALTARTQTGLDWEVIVQIAILLRCIGEPGANIDLPFLGDCKVSGTICVTIPAECESLDQAHSFISNCIRSLATETVAFITPQFAKFPDYDGFLVYKEAVVGIQIKLTRGYPKHPVPDWISEAFLIRGNVTPATTYVDEKWAYLSKEEMVALLGYSMAPLYPNTWPGQPLFDDFL